MRPLLWGVVLICACSRSEQDPAQLRRAPIAVPGPDAAPITRETVGVVTCDAYVEAFGRCIRKMDKAAQPAARAALSSLRRSWVLSSRSSDGGASLAHACQLATEAARAATAGIGCSY